jgi:hypothetical protein
MPDFNAKYDPTQNNMAMIQAMKNRASQRNPLAVAIDSGMEGVDKGLKISEALGKIKEKREQKAMMAKLIAENPEVNKELGGFAELMDPKDAATTYATIKLKKASGEVDDTLNRAKAEKYQLDNQRNAQLARLEYKILIGKKLTPGEQTVYDNARKAKLLDEWLAGQIMGPAGGANSSTGAIPGLSNKGATTEE